MRKALFRGLYCLSMAYVAHRRPRARKSDIVPLSPFFGFAFAIINPQARCSCLRLLLRRRHDNMQNEHGVNLLVVVFCKKFRTLCTSLLFTIIMFNPDTLKAIFKAYDIRGTYPEQLSKEFMYAYGRAFVKVLNVQEVAIGRDMRTSGPELVEGLMQGILDQGANVIDLGMVSTDMLYFATGKYQYESGIMLTASHNPKEYNGMKACLRDAVPVGMDEGNKTILEILIQGIEFEYAEQKGTVEKRDILADWVEYVLSFVDVAHVKPMKVVVDAGNGMAGIMAQELFKKIPQVEMIPMYFEPDGNFPNHPPYPLEELNLVDLKGRMEQEGADLGLAFDGDADRVVLVDNEFETLSGTLMTAMVAEMLLKKNPGALIIYNALVGRVVQETIDRMGGRGLRVRVGHTFLKQAMKEHGGLFAGEHSAHYYFRDNWNADSGIIAAVIMLGFISDSHTDLAELRKVYGKYKESGEINFTVLDIPSKLERLKEVFKNDEQDYLDGVTFSGNGWWVNVRPSNTEPLLRLNAEADTDELLQEKVAAFTKIITE